ncbi:3-ketoacyl-CoA thiolase B, peroxisomal [Heterocephalus glaber]|uniref:3-ketoacyl-CoA thiolase B, peroxisomal n=1 Tax=Heterocephalus glaber TaxID=10181 RepID=G5C5P5_HETGA|nr:3-ketoacyl-CoA thiolase B, peroxisomal [Heterocephalus glaber]
MLRLQVVLGHLSGRPQSNLALQAEPCLSGFPPASAADVVVVHGRRTAIGRAGRGGFKEAGFSTTLTCGEKRENVRNPLVQQLRVFLSVGNVLQPGAGALVARIAQFLSGIPETVPLSTVNRQCSSGLQAVANIAGGIRNGSYDIGMACGVESMSLAERGNPGNITSSLLENEKARDCLIPMGLTSENVAERFGISREKQDTFALASQQKAARAQSRGCFRAEIVPVTTTIQDDKGTKKTITVSQDEGIRPNTTMEGLAKLKPAFKDGGSTTAGNSSQVSDGAAAILLARRSKAEELGLPILGVLRSYAVVGVPPDIMGIGPAYAIPVALQKAGLTVNDVDIFEINEAFASQAVYCVEKLGIPPEKVNPLGGAVALGHPLGCTGARQVITLLNELKRRGKRAYGVVSMCIGTGMGAAAVFEYPGN